MCPDPSPSEDRCVPAPENPTVAETIAAKMPDLSPSELRIARVLRSDYPSAGLSTVSDLAARASTSTATVVRFCTHLGFAGYSDLQVRLRAELTSRHASPASRAHHDEWAPSDGSDGVGSALDLRADLVRRVRETVPTAEFDRAVALLADPARTLLFSGGKFSHLAARYLQLQLRHLRPRTYFVDDALRLDVGYILDARKGDVVVIMDFRRYDPLALTLAEFAKKRGCAIVLFTDVWLSPVSQLADVVIPLAVEAALFDSMTGLFAAVESLVPAVAQRLGSPALERMDSLEELRRPRTT
nr:MurR/RpiR family transcriptional regulator [Conyzicola lurida]